MNKRSEKGGPLVGPAMRGRRILAILVIMVAASIAASDFAKAQDIVGSIQDVDGRGSPQPYPPSAQPGGIVWTDTFQYDGAGFVKLRFEDVQLGANDQIIVRDPQNLHRQTLTIGNGATFWAVSVLGDTAIVELISDGVTGGGGFDVNMVGLGSIFPAPSDPPTEDPHCIGCGPDVECSPAIPSVIFPGQFVPPAVYPCRTPVCAIIYPFAPLGVMYKCTGWVIGDPNQVITNKHCEPPAGAGGWAAAECWFNSEAVVCDGVAQKAISMYSVAVEVCSSLPLDYSVLSVHPIPPETQFPAVAFGQLTVRITPIVLDEVTHVFHHSIGCEKQYSGGVVTALVGPGCVANPGFPTPPADEFNSSALITGGASGSPVMGDDCCVFGLLHCEFVGDSCNPNISVKMSSIVADPAFAGCLPNIEIWEPNQPPSQIPTVSTWGLITMTLLLLTAGTIILHRQRRAPAPA